MGVGFRVQGLGFRVQSFGFIKVRARVHGKSEANGFRGSGPGFRVRLRARGLRFRV